MPYIKLEDAINHIMNHIPVSCTPDFFDGQMGCVAQLKSLPTADVVEVVRCCKCVHYEPHGNGKKGICRHSKLKAYLKNDIDFCSYGERRC